MILLAFTAGRWNYLDRTLASFDAQVTGDFTERVMVNDAGDADYAAWLTDALPDWHIISHPENRGLGAAIESAWSLVRQLDAGWVFHLEEDFTFDRPLDVADLTATCEAHELTQVCLYRQPVNPQEANAGGFLRLHRGRYAMLDESPSGTLYGQSELFSYNPCVYPSWVCDRPGGLEAEVTLPGDYYGLLAGPGDSPLVHHIGDVRSAGWSR